MTLEKTVRSLLSQLLLSLSKEKFEVPLNLHPSLTSVVESIKIILEGNSSIIIKETYSDILQNEMAKDTLKQYPSSGLDACLSAYVDKIREVANESYGDATLANLHLQLIGIAFLQTFVQLNFTGPNIDFSAQEVFFNNSDVSSLHADSIKCLKLEAQQAYDLTSEPIFLILSLLIFENLLGLEKRITLVNQDVNVTIDEVTESTQRTLEGLERTSINGSLQWWRSRALQVHLSILSEAPSVIPAVCSLLLNPTVVNSLVPSSDGLQELQRHVQLSYFLESARSGIQSFTESLSIPFLEEAKKLSGFSFVLSGAKAKRTKFQKFLTSSLLILAQSKESTLFDVEVTNDKPESFDLNSDVLLERPKYEQLDDIEFSEDQVNKKIKLDPSTFSDEADTRELKLLPIAMRQEDIPAELKLLDPNNQPVLNDLDNIQLLLRLTTLRQTSPSQDPLVEEELLAMVNRILHVDAKNVNWTVFSRALWERSILETNRAKTIERGILQMTSLVEESNIKVKSRIIPQSASENDFSQVSSRLRFIHQLPLMPHWTMDSKLAEKYMSIGILRSAIEIYERLNMACEAALCYATVDSEKEAERILLNRIESHPDDARAISILGDIRQDPELWMKAWNIGKYANAKASLAKYYYNPPRGVEKNLALAISHMNDSLTRYPTNYENWYFYGCMGLEASQFEIASEAFTRCVSLDETNSHAWSNLASALLRLDKVKPAFNALKMALKSAREGKKSWRIFENYLVVAAKLNEWNDVLLATKELIKIKGEAEGESAIDIPVIEKLVEILTSTKLPEEGERYTHFQTSCIDLICNILPSVITTSARCWRIVARVELWRKKPWIALECHEKAYRALSQRAELEFEENAWNEAVDACSDLIAAYESLGELPGKHDAGDLVCKDWKYKARSLVRSLISKGKAVWEDSEGWYRLKDMLSDLSNN